MEYDLEGRTLKFSKRIVNLMKGIRLNHLNRNIIDQLMRCSTSVGANYREATAASSRKDFRNKIHICRKEIQETKYWVELLSEVEDSMKSELRSVWKEAHELTLIFNKISSSLKH